MKQRNEVAAVLTQSPRTALVTGAAQGIGYAVASQLAADGHNVVLVDVDGEQLAAAASRLENARYAVSAFQGDVASSQCAPDAVSQAERIFGGLHILINNAGISPSHSGRSQDLEDVPLAEWERVLAVNLTGPFLFSRAALPLMKRAGWGRIVNFSSQGGRTRSLLSGAHYGATKAGLIGFTRVLAGQVGQHNITANCIAPGRIDTEQSRGFGDTAAFLEQVPVKRLGEPDDIAAGVRYLVSDQAGFITGAILDINGGFFMP